MATVEFVVIGKDGLDAYDQAYKSLANARVTAMEAVQLQEPIAEGYCGWRVTLSITPDLSEYVVRDIYGLKEE